MKIKLSVLLSILSVTAFAQTDNKLTAKLQDAIKGFNGQLGIYVKNLKTGKTAAINAVQYKSVNRLYFFFLF